MDVQELFALLKPNPDNPRTIKNKKFEILKNKIDDFPQMLGKRPIVYDSKNNYMILGGHKRYDAIRDLIQKGFTLKDEYFSDCADWTDAQKREFIVIDNITDGEWDYKKLESLYEAPELREWGMDLPAGFGESDTEEDQAGATPEVPKSKPGEMYQLGKHRLICGDSRDPQVILRLMGGQTARMVFTDPPYNVNYGASMKDALRHKTSPENNGRKILNDHFETNQEFYEFLNGAIAALKGHVQGDIYICMSSSELHTLQKAFLANDGHWSTFLIWVKNNFTLGRSNYQRQYEPILYGWFEESSHYWSGARNLGDVIKTEDLLVGESGDKYIKVEGVPTDVWEFPKPMASKEHPTMKPVALVGRAVKNSSQIGDIVLDTFGGSGSTLIACQQLERVCYMVELDPKYCDVIRQRYWKYTTQSDEGWEEGTPVVAGV